MNTPIAALAWEIWGQKRRWVWAVLGLMVCGGLFNLAWPGRTASEATRGVLLTINGFMEVGTLLLVFGVFNHTENNSPKDWAGFPSRHFTLPATSLILVAVPLGLGVAAAEVVYFVWWKIAYAHLELSRPGWLAVLVGAYMALYQSTLWILAGYRSLRVIALALIGTSFVAVAFLPNLGQYSDSVWFSVNVLSALVSGLGAIAFLAAWRCVDRQRSGAGSRRPSFPALIARLTDALPRRSREFSSPAAAQFWVEMRQGGRLLPFCMAALLLVLIGPLSWFLRDEPATTVWILGWLLAAPILLALPIGKGFSKPEFWSGNLSLPGWIAVRPFATGDLVVIKMKVAALSALLTWLLVLAFLAAWLPLWANLDALSLARVGYWMAYSHSVLPQYGIAAAGVLAGMLLTWRGLVVGLWVGLSGNRKLFAGSAVAALLVPLLGLIALAVLLDHDAAVRRWIWSDPDRPIAILEWCIALAVITRLWLGVHTWRTISPERLRTYLGCWLLGTLGLMAGAHLLWADGALALYLMAAAGLLPMDVERLRNLLFLIALLLIPIARLGLAPAFLSRNRHQS